MTTNVYCYASGHIGFCSGSIPAGALPIKFKATKTELKRIKVMARLAYDNKTLLVPGIPEAPDDGERYEAFKRFVAIAVGNVKPQQVSA